MTGAFICGCSGLELTKAERAFFTQSQPWALIVFKRNIENPDQLRSLVADFRDCCGAQAPVLIDQEGGRVQRMGPPHWRKYPAAQRFLEKYRADPVAGLRATRLAGQALGQDLYALGINVSCLPVLDVPQPGAHDIIGDRAYGATPSEVAILARAHVTGLMAAGVQGVIKHIPGHGRALADSHMELPVVDAPLAELAAIDFPPFAALADLSMAMTAHVVYQALDPDQPATLSSTVINNVIRQDLGFNGLLMSDDLSMQALSGSLKSRGEKALQAGCDILLHCNGELAEMQHVAEAAGTLSGTALMRAELVIKRQPVAQKLNMKAAEKALADLQSTAAI